MLSMPRAGPVDDPAGSALAAVPSGPSRRARVGAHGMRIIRSTKYMPLSTKMPDADAHMTFLRDATHIPVTHRREYSHRRPPGESSDNLQLAYRSDLQLAHKRARSYSRLTSLLFVFFKVYVFSKTP
jgi:hypothetical protein